MHTGRGIKSAWQIFRGAGNKILTLQAALCVFAAGPRQAPGSGRYQPRFRLVSGLMPRMVDNGAGLLDNNGKPKLLLRGPLERVSVGIRNIDDSGVGEFDSSGRPKLRLRGPLDLVSVPILNSDDSGVGLRLSSLMPNTSDSA